MTAVKNSAVQKLKRMFNYSPKDFELVRFFSYTSTITYKFTTFEFDRSNMYKKRDSYPNIQKKFADFFDGLASMASEMSGKSKWFFEDNKVVFQIRHKFSGQVFFIGHYDMRIAIGTGCHLYDGYIYDFKSKKQSDYISNIMADERNLWKQFEL